MTFENRLKLRQIAAAICFFAGIGMIFLSFHLDGEGSFLYLHSFYCGGGGGMIGASIANFVRAHTLLKDPEKRREAEIKEMDERNIHIQRVSYSIFVTVSLVLTCAASVVAGLFSPLVCFVLLTVAICQLVLLLVVTFIVRRKY